MIDLHLHTTASDGSSTPAELLAQVRAAGLTTFAVTDHDTVASLPEMSRLADAAGLAFVPGIEVTAVHEGRDVHVLGYFIDHAHEGLQRFLTSQLDDRRRRVLAMAERLAELGMPIDIGRLSVEADRESRRALGRPMLASALVGAGHVRSVHEAFERYLDVGKPAFVTRVGATPLEVTALVSAAGGISSVAHPGKLPADVADTLPAMGLDAIEVYHPDHSPEDQIRFRKLAESLGLGVSGGSDFHGIGSGRKGALGSVSLPADDFRRLRERAAQRRAHA